MMEPVEVVFTEGAILQDTNGQEIEEVIESTTASLVYEDALKDNISTEGMWVGASIGGVFSVFAIALACLIKLLKI